jgi:hypothetical protein
MLILGLGLIRAGVPRPLETRLYAAFCPFCLIDTVRIQNNDLRSAHLQRINHDGGTFGELSFNDRSYLEVLKSAMNTFLASLFDNPCFLRNYQVALSTFAFLFPSTSTVPTNRPSPWALARSTFVISPRMSISFVALERE